MFALKKYTFIFLVSGIAAIFLVQSAGAAPPIPGTYDPDTMIFYETGLKVPVHYDSPGPMREPEAYRGVWYFPVIFIETPDFAHTYSVEEWSEQLFTIGTHSTGSMRDYYREISYDQFDIDGIAVGWIMADHDYSYYHQNNYGFGGGAAEMAQEAVIKAEALFNPDWSQFDNDGDGKVDGVVIIHMGPGGEGGNPNQIWSHVSSFDPVEFDGVTISRYSIQPETRGSGLMETIGTLCHEHGHILGLPDLYDINYTNKPTPVGVYCLMASGSSGGNPMGSRPAHPSGWCKSALGWVTPTVITEPGNFTINAIQTHTTQNSYRIDIPDSDEYFLLANRWMDAPLQFEGIPKRFLGGLLIYHVDDSITGSNDGNNEFWRVVIEDAGADTPRDLADAGFSAATSTEFGRFTNPNTSGNRHPSGLTVRNVSTRGEQMSFSVDFEPVLMLKNYSIQPLGNKRFSLSITLENITTIQTDNLELIIATAAQNVTFESGVATLGTIGPNKTATSSPFIFRTTDDVTSFESFTVKAQSSTYEGDNISFTIPVNPARILLVDDDHTKGMDYNIEVLWKEGLDLTPIDYQVWKVWNQGLPFITMIQLYDLVIWCDGILQQATPRAGQSLDLIAEYLDKGGDMIWSSHEFLYSQYGYPAYTETKPGDFAREYLRILELEQDEFFYEGFGVQGTITQGMHLRLEDVYSVDPDAYTPSDYNWWPDEFITDDTCIPILTAGDRNFPPGAPDDWKTEESMLQNATCAMLHQGQYRLMFMSVGLHGISLDPADHPNTRQEFLNRIFAWFGITDHSPGLDIDVNSPMFEAGDTCHVTCKIVNPGPSIDLQLYIAMEAYGLWLFGPAWNETVNHYPLSIPAGDQTMIDVFPPFAWPSGAGSGTVTFWSVMLNAANGQMVGNYDFTPFNWQ